MSLDIIKKTLQDQREKLVAQVNEVKIGHDAEIAMLVEKFQTATGHIYDEIQKLDKAIDALDGRLQKKEPEVIYSPRQSDSSGGYFRDQISSSLRSSDGTVLAGGGRNINPRQLKPGIAVNFDFSEMSKLNLDHTGSFFSDRNAIAMLLVEMDGLHHIWAPLATREQSNCFEIPRSMKIHEGQINSTWLENESWVICDKFRFGKEHLAYTNQIGTKFRCVNDVLIPKIQNWLRRGSPDITRLAK